MAESRRVARVSATVRNALTEVLQAGIKDPRCGAAGLVTVTGVEVTADLSQARVYLTATDDAPEAVRQMLGGFESAARFLRSEVARRVSLKRVPELRFQLDPAIRHGRRIDAILAELDTDES